MRIHDALLKLKGMVYPDFSLIFIQSGTVNIYVVTVVAAAGVVPGNCTFVLFDAVFILCLVLSCPVLSCLVLSCLVLSCLVLSSLVFASPRLASACLASPCLASPHLVAYRLFWLFVYGRTKGAAGGHTKRGQSAEV